jgi:preprotein translocase subunit SecB
MRHYIINLIKYHTYKQCILLPIEFNGNIYQKMINQNKYRDFHNIDNLSNLPPASENIFEIVMKKY